ncbi:50S ribosome-binding GTPase [Saccharopolyspora erythraea]|uniref:GTPase n=1 Tax=Saccharopolyspora erythraea TaxID=1836 RepID=UPI001BA8E40C|nr:GTPase [Saccharopolyspora erythraea]QUH03206.1 50S ribosome-binding GTPase [Saccharopolyspora erythraea]
MRRLDVVLTARRLWAAGYLATVFLVVVGGLGAPFGWDGKAVIALSFVAAGIAAAGHFPLQRWITPWLHRSQSCAALTEVAGGLTAVGSLEQALPTMARMLAEETRADHASLWLTVGGRLVSAASWPAAWAGATHAVADLDGLRALPGVDHAVPVVDAHLSRGALAIGKPEPVTDRDLRVMHNIAGGAGLLLRSVALNTELEARVRQAEDLGAELTASRQRLMHARDVERRRLVTEIANVTTASLAEISAGLEQVRELAATDPEDAERSLARLRPVLDEVIDRFRTVVRGVYPGVLRDDGPRAALEELASDLARPVQLSGHFGDRVDWETESGIYFATAAAMRLFGGQPSAEPLAVRIGHDYGRLTARVEEPDPQPGAVDPRVALADDQDRLAALGGGLRCRETASGVTVTAWLPDRLEPLVPRHPEAEQPEGLATTEELPAEEEQERAPEEAREPDTLRGRVRALVTTALEHYGSEPAGRELTEAAARLDEPLRVAVAGNHRCGKTTLVNALVGRNLAEEGPTRTVTLYRGGTRPGVTVHPTEGEPHRLPTANAIDPAGMPAGQVDHLEVESPSSALRGLTLIDLPPLDSAEPDAAGRARALLTSVGSTDVVLLLADELGSEHPDLLDRIREHSPVVVVIAQADRFGGAGGDAMRTARVTVAEYLLDPRLRRACQAILPVAGLLAASGATLREPEYQSFHRLSLLGEAEVADLLRSPEHFARTEAPRAPGPGERAALLRRFGIFGVRLAAGLVRDGEAESCAELSAALVRESGIEPVRDLLRSRFAELSEVRRARAALRAVEEVLHGVAPDDPHRQAMSYELDRIRGGAHEFVEVDVIDTLRGVAVPLREQERVMAERLLGASGTDPHVRLALPAAAAPEEVRRAAAQQLAWWRERAENPAATRDVREVCLAVVRSCEGMLGAW